MIELIIMWRACLYSSYHLYMIWYRQRSLIGPILIFYSNRLLSYLLALHYELYSIIYKYLQNSSLISDLWRHCPFQSFAFLFEMSLMFWTICRYLEIVSFKPTVYDTALLVSLYFITYLGFSKIYGWLLLDGKNNSFISNSQCNGRIWMEAISKVSWQIRQKGIW